MLSLLESMRKIVFCRRKMAAWRAKLNDGDMSCSCFGMIIYTCLKCKIPVCNKNSILEDEDYHGWVASKTVAFKTVCILLFSLFSRILSKRKAFARRLLPESMAPAMFTIVMTEN